MGNEKQRRVPKKRRLGYYFKKTLKISAFISEIKALISQLEVKSVPLWFKLKKNKGGVSTMLIINIKDNEPIDKALKRFKKKFEKTGMLRQLRKRQAFEKPSIARRTEMIRASYKETMYGDHTEG